MSVRIVGTLLDPFDNPYPNTTIRVTTVVGTGNSLVHAEEEYVTDAEGLYDFTLVDGTHSIYIVWENTLEYIGCAVVNDGSPDPTDIQGIIDYVTPSPVLPPLSDSPTWCDLYEDVVCSPDSQGKHITCPYGAGDALYQKDIKVFCNERIGSNYAEHSDLVCTGVNSCAIDQMQTYTDTAGSLSSYHTSSVYSGNQCDVGLISFTEDGVGNICSQKDEIFCTETYEELTQIDVSNNYVTRNSRHKNNAFQLWHTEIFDDAGLSITAGSSTCSTTSYGDVRVATGYMDGSTCVCRPIVCSDYRQCVGASIRLCNGMSSRQKDDGTFETRKHYTSVVGNKTAAVEINNDGLCPSHRQAGTIHEIGTYCSGEFCPSMSIDTDKQCIIFCGDVEFNAATCDALQGPPGDSERLEIQYSPNKTGPWDGSLDEGDKWQRYRVVTKSGIDGTEAYGPWIGPFNLYAEDGLPGDTYYYEYEYSVDGISGWHEVLVEGDNFRRERIVADGNIGDWSVPARIKGDDGIDGTGVSVVYDYSTNALSDTPNWHPNFSVGDYWRRERYYSTIAGEVADEPYSTVIIKIIPEKGVDYYDGINTKTVYLSSTTQGFVYEEDGTTPNPATALFTASPSSTVSADPYYYFKVDSVTVQASTNPEYLYAAPALASLLPQTVSVEVAPDDVSAVVAADQITVVGLVNGANGYDGVTVILSNEAHTFAADSDGNILSYENGGTDVQVYIGATALTYGTGANQYIVEAIGQSIQPNPTPTTINGTIRRYGTPSNMIEDFAEIGFTVTLEYEGIGTIQITKVQSFALSKDGEVGPPGQSTYTAQVYIRSATDISTPPTGGSYDFETDTLVPPTGWFDSIPDGTDPVWASNNTFFVQGTGIGTADEWGIPFKMVENGTDGTVGVSTYTGYIYRRIQIKPVAPIGGCFDFGNNTLTPPPNWCASIPDGTLPVWATSNSFSVQGDTGEDLAGEWADPFKYIENGEDGLDGQSTYAITIYKRNATKPAQPAGGQYDFGLNELTPPAGGWSQNIPDGDDPVWSSQETAVASGPTGIDTTLNWTDPILVFESGESVAQIQTFRRSATPITTQPSGGSFNFSTQTLTPPTGWSATIPDGTDPIYASITNASVKGSQYIDNTLIWSTPVKTSQDGGDGQSTYQANIYRRDVAAPGTPYGGSFNFGTNILTPPVGWTVSPDDGDRNSLWTASQMFTIIGDTGIDNGETWSVPKLFTEDGLDGRSTYMVSIFIRTDAEVVDTPIGGQYNFTTNQMENTPFGWYDYLPNTAGKNIFQSNALATIIGPTGTDTSLTWSTPARQASDGAPGPEGDAGAGYYSFEGTMPSTNAGKTTCFNNEVGRYPVQGDTFVAYNDVTESTDGYQYRSSDGAWIAPTMKIDGGLIVNGTIGALQIAACSISGEKIQANTKIVVGTSCVGHDVITLDGTDPTFRIAVGCSTYTDAPFRVTKEGILYGRDVCINGSITSKSGCFSGRVTIGSSLCGSSNWSFIDGQDTSIYAAYFGGGKSWIKKNGEFYAQNGCFQGDITGASGCFSGTVYADKISGGVYSQADIDTPSVYIPDAYRETVTIFDFNITTNLTVDRTVEFEYKQYASVRGGTVERYRIRDTLNGVIIKDVVYYGNLGHDTTTLIGSWPIHIPANSSGYFKREFVLEDENTNPDITFNFRTSASSSEGLNPVRATLFMDSNDLTN